MRFESITKDALSLPEEERTQLAYRLLESVDPPDPHAHLSDAEFAGMLAKRMRDVQSGTAQTISADEVFAKLRAKYARGR